MELNGMINKFLVKNPETRRRALQIRTYVSISIPVFFQLFRSGQSYTRSCFRSLSLSFVLPARFPVKICWYEFSFCILIFRKSYICALASLISRNGCTNYSDYPLFSTCTLVPVEAREKTDLHSPGATDCFWDDLMYSVNLWPKLVTGMGDFTS